VPDHLLIGNALVVDLPLLGSSRSAGTREYSDRRSAAVRRSLVLATNRNGGMLRLNASRHNDDDD